MVAPRPLIVNSSPDGLAVTQDMAAGYGESVPVGMCLGGGGLWFVAWQVTYLHELLQAGIDLKGADRVVGTSAGSIVSSVLEAGNLKRLHGELKVLARLPKLLGVLAPAAKFTPAMPRLRPAASCTISTARSGATNSARSSACRNPPCRTCATAPPASA